MTYRLAWLLLAVFSPLAQGAQTLSGTWDSVTDPGLGVASAFIQDSPETYLSLECTLTHNQIDLRLSQNLSPSLEDPDGVTSVIFEMEDKGTYALVLRPLEESAGLYGSVPMDHPLIQDLREARRLRLRSATDTLLANIGLSDSSVAIRRMLDFCRQAPEQDAP